MKKRNEKKNNCWENLEGFRYAHRGLFHQPRSASRKLNEMTGRDGRARRAAGDTGHAAGDTRRTAGDTWHVAGDVPWRDDIIRWKSEGRRIVPENSMKAFRMAVRHGFGSELDVHLTADGKLAVFHDDSLRRMTGIDRRIADMTWDEISKVRLIGTDSRIPLLEEVLDLYTSDAALTDRTDARYTKRTYAGFNGLSDEAEAGIADTRTGESSGLAHRLHLPLIIELKAEKNIPMLCGKVMETLDRHPGLNYCVESFDPRVVLWLRRNRPDVIRGQLTENFMKSREAVRQWGHLMTFGMWSAAPDIISRPDFISCKFRDRKNVFIQLSHRHGVRQVNWIIKNRKELDTVDREGGLSIFERFIPDRAEA